MKLKIITVLFTLFTFSASADFTMIIPQKPGSGTSQWAMIVAKHMEKHLGEKIKLKHIPGARDIPGFNKFHNKLRFDEKTIMVSHGGNAVGYLTEKVDYEYKDYTAIGGMNLTIVMGSKDLKDKAIFAGGSGNVPDAMALTLYMCGNLKTMEELLTVAESIRLTLEEISNKQDEIIDNLTAIRGDLSSVDLNISSIEGELSVIDSSLGMIDSSIGLIDINS